MSLPQFQISDARLLELIAAVKFKAATSERYRNEPHEYIVAHASKDTFNLWACMGLTIYSRGYSKAYGKWNYWYYEIDGYKYWVMEEILNREKLP